MTNLVPTYREQGEGPAVVFLHGLGGNRHVFDLQIDALSSHYRCIAWDAPGYGGSPPLEDFTFDNLAICLANLLEKLRIKPHAIVGYSMGGMIAQTWVARGGLADKLVLAQTSARFGKPGSDFNKDFLEARLKPLDDGLKPADFAEEVAVSMLHNKSRADSVAPTVESMSQISADVYRQVLQELVTFDELANLKNILIPTLCLAAEGDTTAPPKGMMRMAESVAAGEFVCLPDAGHLAFLETPDAYNDALRDFLGRK
jgi:3-oxoadipate enol-lactonase